MAHSNPANRCRNRRLFDDRLNVETEIENLPALDATVLRERWRALFGAAPSPLLGRLFMARAIAYRLQERRFGGLKPSAQRVLERVGDGGAESGSKRIRSRTAGAGTVLIREWGGVSHRVTVLDRGVVYRGKRFQSLSEVAREITGARWSGPRFFGLRTPMKELANG